MSDVREHHHAAANADAVRLARVEAKTRSHADWLKTLDRKVDAGFAQQRQSAEELREWLGGRLDAAGKRDWTPMSMVIGAITTLGTGAVLLIVFAIRQPEAIVNAQQDARIAELREQAREDHDARVRLEEWRRLTELLRPPTIPIPMEKHP
jgi:hypothetical protein